MSLLNRLRPDNFTLTLVGTMLFATFLPCSGTFARTFDVATQFAIGLLFFLQGARLSRQAVFAGMAHWRLHLTISSFTYALFPLTGLLITMLFAGIITPELAASILFLCCLPSTMQSSVAFTSIAGGNVPAALCSASASSLIGVFLTPLLVGLLMRTQGGVSLDSIKSIVLQLLAPFVAGQMLRPLIGAWAVRHKTIVGLVDRGSILMVVYSAFSDAVINGIWRQLTPLTTGIMVAVNVVLLAFVLTMTTWLSRRLHFNRQDEIAIVFCGSKKSLGAGVPMANILFAGHAVGMIVLPVMLFHQIQLMACSVLARRYADRAPADVA